MMWSCSYFVDIFLWRGTLTLLWLNDYLCRFYSVCDLLEPNNDPESKVNLSYSYYFFVAVFNLLLSKTYRDSSIVYCNWSDIYYTQVFISTSYDATSHFETTCEDVLNLYEKVTGEPIDFATIKSGNIETAEGQWSLWQFIELKLFVFSSL